MTYTLTGSWHGDRVYTASLAIAMVAVLWAIADADKEEKQAKELADYEEKVIQRLKDRFGLKND